MESTVRIGRTYDDSVPAEPPAQRGAGADRPNVIIWVMDDVGFGQLSAYGGPVDAPTIERIARGGTTFTNGHTTPLCAPTRACVMTGRNHHTNHLASLPRFAAEFPGHDGRVPMENGFLSEVLRDEGYATFCVGKWHLTPVDQMGTAGERDSWPLGRGFDRFYGFMGGMTNQFYPQIVEDNHYVTPPERPEAYHLTDNLVDTSARYVKELRTANADKPFFLYLAFGASHAPLHAPKGHIDAYRGQFDGGYETYRDEVFARQKELGIVPKATELSEHDPDVPRWRDLDEDEARVSARMMEAFAGMTTHMDEAVGRLMDELDALGELENTVFVVLSDNGASAEGGPLGADNVQYWPGGLEPPEPSIATIDDIGGSRSFANYPWGWAWAGNTPFRRWKRETYRGGCAVPFMVSWPGMGTDGGALCDRFVHAIDIMPTILDGLGIESPETIRYVPQAPIEGASFLPLLEDANTDIGSRNTQYFEMFGHRAMYHEGWRAVCPWPGTSFSESGRTFPSVLRAEDLDRLERNGWELYNLDEDPSETRNLAAEEPGKLRELVDRWWQAAEEYQVLPLIGRLPKGLASGLTSTSEARSATYFRDLTPVNAEAVLSVINRSHRITADISITDGATEGCLLAFGDYFGGYALFMEAGHLVYAYNMLGESTTVLRSPGPLTPGDHTVSYEFRATGEADIPAGNGAPGDGAIMVDGEVVASGPIERTAPLLATYAGVLSCGYHSAEPITSDFDYTAPFRFTGGLEKVVVELID